MDRKFIISNLRYLYLVLWTLFLFLVIYEYTEIINEGVDYYVVNSADKGLIKDYMYRSWASKNGGIYLKEINNTGDTTFKLINPVLMTKLMLGEIFGKNTIDDISERIVILNQPDTAEILTDTEKEAIEFFNKNYSKGFGPPSRQNLPGMKIFGRQNDVPPGLPPDNKKDLDLKPAIEKGNNFPPQTSGEGLPAFADIGGNESFTKIVDENGRKFLKIIKPVRIKTSCLTCHDRNNYVLGNLSAITSFSSSIEQTENIKANLDLGTYIIGFIIWTLGIIIIEFGYKKYKQYTRELRSVNKRLEISEQKLCELNDSKDKYFSILSHDLKNSFHSVLSYSDYIVSDFENINGNDLKEGIIHCNTSTKKIYNLLEDLLTWNKMQTGTLEYKPEEFSFDTVVTQVIELLGDKAASKNISIKVNAEQGLIISADKEMFKTVIRNLVSNSIKFTNRDGKVIIIGKKEIDAYIFSVKDNGVGMDAENKNKLFKLDNSFTTRGTESEKGTGLGLIICRDMINKHSGKIWVDSEVGKGTTFHFSIPVNHNANSTN